MNRVEKQNEINKIREVYSSSKWVFIINYKGLNVSEAREIRTTLASQGCTMKVVKNSLNRIATQNTKFATLSDHFKDQVAIVYGEDPVAMAKIIYENISKKQKIALQAYSDGSQIYSQSSLEQLAKLPPVEVLRSGLLAMLLSPATSLVRLLQEPASRFARVLDIYSKSNN